LLSIDPKSALLARYGGQQQWRYAGSSAVDRVGSHDVRWAGFGRTGPSALIGWAFVVLTVGSLIWIVIGYVSGEYALMAQNIVLTLINLFGIYRWLIWKGKI
jgi:hypothetical protein